MRRSIRRGPRRPRTPWGIALAVVLASLLHDATTAAPAHAADSTAQHHMVANAIMLAIPGAMDAGLDAPLFWGSLAFALAVAGAAAVPVNMWLIRRGRGHAVVHGHHGHA